MSPEPSIREFDVEYGPTIAQHANREVEQGYEIHLRIIRVQVRIGSAGQDSTTFEVVFKADHEGEAVEFHSVGDAYDNETAFRPEEIMLATELAGKAVAAWLDDVDVPYAAPEHAITVPQADSDPIVHSNLTVVRDEFFL
jgi:hypothetical protein